MQAAATVLLLTLPIHLEAVAVLEALEATHRVARSLEMGEAVLLLLSQGHR
jgi:hypothetical protein